MLCQHPLKIRTLAVPEPIAVQCMAEHFLPVDVESQHVLRLHGLGSDMPRVSGIHGTERCAIGWPGVCRKAWRMKALRAPPSATIVQTGWRKVGASMSFRGGAERRLRCCAGRGVDNVMRVTQSPAGCCIGCSSLCSQRNDSTSSNMDCRVIRLGWGALVCDDRGSARAGEPSDRRSR